METNAPAARPKLAPAAAVRPSLTAVILAPRWRLGRRAAARRAVDAALERWRPHVRRLLVAAQAAAVPALKTSAADELLIVPESDSSLSAVSCALSACPEDPLLLLDPAVEVSPERLDEMAAALLPRTPAVALVHPEKRLLPFPLLVRQAARPLIEALLEQGCGDVGDLMRRPSARLILLGRD